MRIGIQTHCKTGSNQRVYTLRHGQSLVSLAADFQQQFLIIIEKFMGAVVLATGSLEMNKQ